MWFYRPSMINKQIYKKSFNVLHAFCYTNALMLPFYNKFWISLSFTFITTTPDLINRDRSLLFFNTSQ